MHVEGSETFLSPKAVFPPVLSVAGEGEPVSDAAQQEQSAAGNY